MQHVWLLSEDDLDDVKVGKTPLEGVDASSGTESEELPVNGGAGGGDAEDDGPPPVQQPSASEPQVGGSARAGVTRSGLIRGSPTATAPPRISRPVRTSVSKRKKKFTARSLSEMRLPDAGASGSRQHDAHKLEDEAEDDNWSEDLLRDEVPASKKARSLERSPSIEEIDADQAGPFFEISSPNLGAKDDGPSGVREERDLISKSSSHLVGKSSEVLDRLLGNVLPKETVDHAKTLTDLELQDGSDKAFCNHLLWALNQRDRFQSLSHQCSIQQSQLLAQGTQVQDLKSEVSELKREKKNWANSAEKVAELEAAKCSLDDALIMANAKVRERDSVITAKDEYIASLRAELSQKEGQILSQANQVASHASIVEGLSDQIQAERAAKEYAVGELKKLRSGLGSIGSKVLKDPSVTEPFTAYAQGLREYGGHHAASLALRLLFSEDPSLMPKQLSALIKPNCRDAVKELFDQSCNAKSAYLAKLEDAGDVTVDELLAIEP